MTAWLHSVLDAVPTDFKPDLKVHQYELPSSATLLGPVPDEIRLLTLAYLFLRESIAERHKKDGEMSFDEYAWGRQQLEALVGLITVSVHQHFEVKDGPVGVGPDEEGNVVAYKLPFPRVRHVRAVTIYF